MSAETANFVSLQLGRDCLCRLAIRTAREKRCLSRFASGLSGESRHNVQALGVSIGVFGISRCPFKCAASEASTLYLVAPDVLVDCLEVIF